MANKNKAKGTKAETAVVKFLKEYGISAERKVLKGNKDEGDVRAVIDGIEYLFEVKSGKQTANPNRTQLTEWMRQTVVEADNAGIDPCNSFLVVVRFNRQLKDADVYKAYWDYSSGQEVIGWIHMYLDRFADGGYNEL